MTIIQLDNAHLAGESNQDEAKITKSTRASLDVAESRYEAHDLLKVSFETGPHAPLHTPKPSKLLLLCQQAKRSGMHLHVMRNQYAQTGSPHNRGRTAQPPKVLSDTVLDNSSKTCPRVETL
jgi:hypothetical protein